LVLLFVRSFASLPLEALTGNAGNVVDHVPFLLVFYFILFLFRLTTTLLFDLRCWSGIFILFRFPYFRFLPAGFCAQLSHDGELLQWKAREDHQALP